MAERHTEYATWLSSGTHNSYFCSSCCCIHVKKTDGLMHDEYKECPSCGAKMKGTV